MAMKFEIVLHCTALYSAALHCSCIVCTALYSPKAAATCAAALGLPNLK